ncbi:MAG: magnesium transporter [Bacteroidia bacterium]
MYSEFTNELYSDIEAALRERDEALLREYLRNLHPADIAELMKEQEMEDAKYIFSLITPEKAGDVLAELEDDMRQKFLSSLQPREIVDRFIGEMETDDAADVINELPPKVREEVIRQLSRDKVVSEDLVSLLDYPEDSAGGLMARELVKVNINSDVTQCIESIREQGSDLEMIYAVYVVDDNGVLKGMIPLHKLIVSPSTAKIEDIYFKEIICVLANEPADEVARMMDKYDLPAVPVVNDHQELVGRITIDDVVDFIREEAEEDMQLMSGISEDVEYSDRIFKISRARLPWLLLGLLGGIASSKVIANYEYELEIYPEMAIFIPLIAAMGGNAGVQSSAIVVQSLASKTMGQGGLASKIFKEVAVAMLNGLCCAVLLLGYGFISGEALPLAYTISISLLSVILIASLLGLLIPLMLNSLKVDPALATGPFITTSNDLIGLFVYFMLGRLMYGMF